MRTCHRHLILLLAALGLVLPAADRNAEAPAPGPTLKLEIRRAFDERHSRPYVEAVFTNLTKKTELVVYPPQDGSYYGWLAPHYAFEIVKTADKKKIDLLPRCGNHGGSYDTTRLTIAPGKTRVVKLYPPHALEDGATYRMQLTYEVKAKRYPGPRVSFPSAEKVVYRAWPAGTFVGKVRSKPLTVKW